MKPDTEASRKIEGKAKSVRELLSGAKYTIDYYQREYRWQQKQMMELINDLSGTFLTDYEEGHPRQKVETYRHYFLGSIIISHKNGVNFIIDGQQRLTSLTLLLIFLNQQQKNSEEKVPVADLVCSTKFGRKSFNIDVEERAFVMNALFEGEAVEEEEQPESVQNICRRYRDIDEACPDELKGAALPYFIDWLIENVHLVEITAYNDEDAYTIFETMNDRGLSLTATEMLKGYLLSQIAGEKERVQANNEWRKWVEKLQRVGKEEDADCLKSWLRSQYAQTIRERKKDAVPGDYDRIGTEFHRWVREQNDAIGLKSDKDVLAFMTKILPIYARHYVDLRQASETLKPEMPEVYDVAQTGFTLQYQVMLAPRTCDDDADTARMKVRLIATFLDILLTRRMWNYRSNDYSTMQYAMFLLMKDVRGKGVQDLAGILSDRLAKEELTFRTRTDYALHGMNGWHIMNMLARMTDYLERETGMTPRYMEYITGKGKKRYDIEHVWADHPERHTDEFSHPADFQAYRNRIGALLLLPRSFNSSYNDMPYADKRPHYNGQNVLARTLCDEAYDHNPGLRQLMKASGIPFKAHANFKKADIDARQEVYTQLAEHIWNADRISVLALEGGGSV